MRASLQLAAALLAAPHVFPPCLGIPLQCDRTQLYFDRWFTRDLLRRNLFTATAAAAQLFILFDPPVRPRTSVISHHLDISVRNTAHYRKITLLLLRTVPERYQKVYERMLLVAERVYVGNETTEELARRAQENVLIEERTCCMTCFSSSCFNYDRSYLQSRENATLFDPLLLGCNKAMLGESSRRYRIVSLTSEPILMTVNFPLAGRCVIILKHVLKQSILSRALSCFLIDHLERARMHSAAAPSFWIRYLFVKTEFLGLIIIFR